MLKLSLLSPKLLPTAYMAHNTISPSGKRRDVKLKVTPLYQGSFRCIASESFYFDYRQLPGDVLKFAFLSKDSYCCDIK